MPNKQSITISLSNPCHEDWDKMTANEQGRHCASCNKTVVDFSLYTDKQLIEFFKKATGNVCGRINDYQANRPILITEQPNRTFFHKLLFGTALASWLGLAGTADAQTNNSHALTSQGNPKKIIGHINTAQSNNASDESCTVKGRLYDSTAESKQTVPFAEIQLLTTAKVLVDTAFTDLDGIFTFKIKDEYIGKNLMLSFNYPGYDPETINFVARGSLINIDLNVNERRVFLGQMIIHKELPNDSPDKTVTKPGDTPYNTPHK